MGTYGALTLPFVAIRTSAAAAVWEIIFQKFEFCPQCLTPISPKSSLETCHEILSSRVPLATVSSATRQMKSFRTLRVKFKKTPKNIATLGAPSPQTVWSSTATLEWEHQGLAPYHLMALGRTQLQRFRR